MSDAFGWARAPLAQDLHRIERGGVVYVISDLHMGDGGPTDIFLAKDRDLLRFIDHVDQSGATLIVAGDAIDFAQAWLFERILAAHGKVLGAFSRLAAKGRMLYVLGNHDHDMRFYQEVLNIPVVHGVDIGGEIRVVHGYEYDPIIGPDLQLAERKTRVHHAVERMIGSWLRVPLEHFYNLPNRFGFWFFHKTAILLRARGRFLRWVQGDDSFLRRLDAELEYWTRCQLGDPANMFRPVLEALERSPYQVLVCGHSHLPGLVRTASGKTYANTGSWTFTSSHVLRIAPEGVTLTDWLSGRRYDDRLYRPILEGKLDGVGYFDWWARHYRGWLRYALPLHKHTPGDAAVAAGDQDR